MSDELDFLPKGAPWGADTRVVTTGVLTAVNASTLTCQVAFNDTDPVWMPYVFRENLTALVGQRVWVQRDPLSGRAVLMLGPVGIANGPVWGDGFGEPPRTGTVTSTSPFNVAAQGQTMLCGRLDSYTPVVGDRVLLAWADTEVWAVGKLLDVSAVGPAAPTGLSVFQLVPGLTTALWDEVVGASAYVVHRSVDLGETWTTWTVPSSAADIPLEQGQTVLVRVQALIGLISGATSDPVQYTFAAPDTPSSTQVTITRTLFPIFTGTWFPVSTQWAGWSVTGGPTDYSTLWVGSAFGEGPLEGLALYGDRLAQLDADEITAIEVTLRAGDQGYPTVDVQGTTESGVASGAPHPTGDIVSTALAENPVELALTPDMCEAFRTGAIGGLRVTSGTFGEVRGLSAADGMALRVTYKKTI